MFRKEQALRIKATYCGEMFLMIYAPFFVKSVTSFYQDSARNNTKIYSLKNILHGTMKSLQNNCYKRLLCFSKYDT